MYGVGATPTTIPEAIISYFPVKEAGTIVICFVAKKLVFLEHIEPPMHVRGPVKMTEVQYLEAEEAWFYFESEPLARHDPLISKIHTTGLAPEVNGPSADCAVYSHLTIRDCHWEENY